MTDELTIAHRYLLPPPNGFWKWQEDGEVITWADGQTITFRQELEQILDHLTPQGLPPLGAVLLLLAAARNKWADGSFKTSALAGCLDLSAKSWELIDRLYHGTAGFEKVSRLDPELRTTVEAKSFLAEVVFEHSPEMTTPEDAAVIVAHLRRGIADVVAEPIALSRDWEQRESAPRMLLRDLRCLHVGLKNLDADALKLRQQAGLEEIPLPAKVEEPPTESVRALLKVLEQDDELCGLARLAQQLMAAVTLPRAVADRDELQLGGVSDITNRGPLDRLLLSELANDDFALSVRLAMNEALYLRRESPPRTPQRQRALFLETGLRSWGVPRVFATAVALALAATTDKQTEVLAFRADGPHIAAVDLATRAGLIEHLAALNTELHPADALDAFERELALSDNAAEPVLVTTEDVLADADFVKNLAGRALTPLHLATVNRDGRFRLLERTSRGSKLVREARLDLEQLFAEPKRAVNSLVDREWARDLPAIFSVEPFPLLLSHKVDADRSWTVPGHGVLSLTTDCRLTYWAQPGCGALQIADDIPRGKLWWSSHQPLQSTASAIVGRTHKHGFQWLHIDLERRSCSRQRLDVDHNVRSFCAHNGALFAIYAERVDVVSAESGTVVQVLALPYNISHQRDRFFLREENRTWFALSYDGRTAHLEELLAESSVQSKSRSFQLVTMFEREGVNGPIGVTNAGDFFMTADRTLHEVKHKSGVNVQVVHIASDGSRIMLANSYAPRYAVNIEFETLEVSPPHFATVQQLDEEFDHYVSPRNLRNKFTHIFISQSGQLALSTRKGRFEIEYVYIPGADRIALAHKPQSGSIGGGLRFESMPTHPDVGFKLSRAAWNDGSEALLDSRGLLHLRSANRSIPEVSIVLTDGELSGWCADGRWWGRTYFTGKRPLASKRAVFDTIKAFTEYLR